MSWRPSWICDLLRKFLVAYFFLNLDTVTNISAKFDAGITFCIIFMVQAN